MRILIFSDNRGNERFFLRVQPDDFCFQPEGESAFASCRAEMHYTDPKELSAYISRRYAPALKKLAGPPPAAFDLLDQVREKAQNILDRF